MTDSTTQAMTLSSPGRYKSGFKRAALRLLGVDAYSCIALHMDVIKPLQGTAAYMQARRRQDTVHIWDPPDQSVGITVIWRVLPQILHAGH